MLIKGFLKFHLSSIVIVYILLSHSQANIGKSVIEYDVMIENILINFLKT